MISILPDLSPAPTKRVRLSADFLAEVGAVLERHGHVPTSGASVPSAVGYGLIELSAFVRAVVDTPAVCEGGIRP